MIYARPDTMVDESVKKPPIEDKSIFSDELGEYWQNPKRQGNVGMAACIYFFTKQGYNVSIPLTDSQEYDLLVEDDDGHLYRVQVKTTRYARNGAFECSLMVTGGNRTGVGKKRLITLSKVDLVFILTENEEMYLIPVKVISGKKNISLGIEYQQFRVDDKKGS